MVHERFRFAGALGHTEGVSEEFFDKLEVGRGCECRVEREDGAGPFEAVAWEMKFGHCVYCAAKDVSSHADTMSIWQAITYNFANAS